MHYLARCSLSELNTLWEWGDLSISESNLRPPLIWYVESHESDQSTRKTSRVTRVTLVLWIGNETLRSLPLWERLRVTESWTHIESRQFIGWWRDAVSDAMTSSGHTGERAIHSSDFSAEKNPVGSVRSLAANAVSRSLFREQGLRE